MANQKDYQRIAGLFEELNGICKAADLGNGQEPIWDGTVIGKPQQHTLEDMGLIECCHGYYFPTLMGKFIREAFILEKPSALAFVAAELEKKEGA